MLSQPHSFDKVQDTLAALIGAVHGLKAMAVVCPACVRNIERTFLPLAGRVHKVWDNQECVGSAQAPRLWCVYWP